ncbi:DUF2617 family protein [Corynebacterium lowii]|uniref:DUF2617 family protein n=1 Tax=Corynebacterium lowii TaxID=1544413 RepID=UPI0027D87477|nr:DUF2617 family protein [Corynebacterium lowii]
MLEAQVEPTDVRAEDLALRIDGPLPQDLLAEQWLSRGEYRLHLAVLGASHVVSLHGSNRASGAEALLVREEISTTAPRGIRPLPEAYTREGYSLHTWIFQHDDFEAAAALVAQESWLVVRFPGIGPYHLTAVRAEWTKHGVRWETRHCYPGQSTIVGTRSKVRL